ELLTKFEFVDPMAGSGTLLIEAMGGALKKRNYAYESWPVFEDAPAALSPSRWRFGHHLAVDRDKEQYERLAHNLEPFRVKGHSVLWLCQDSLKSAPDLPKGCIGRILVANPPF